MTEPTKRLLPIIPLDGGPAFMSEASIQEEPTKTTITIVVEGPKARYMGELLATTEPIALTFAGIPVQNHL